MEWDTAAGPAVCEAAGVKSLIKEPNEPCCTTVRNCSILGFWFRATTDDSFFYSIAIMKIEATSVEDYLKKVPLERRDAMMRRVKSFKTICQGFEEVLNYGMPGFVVPHQLYLKGYHCNLNCHCHSSFCQPKTSLHCITWGCSEQRRHGLVLPSMG